MMAKYWITYDWLLSHLAASSVGWAGGQSGKLNIMGQHRTIQLMPTPPPAHLAATWPPGGGVGGGLPQQMGYYVSSYAEHRECFTQICMYICVRFAYSTVLRGSVAGPTWLGLGGPPVLARALVWGPGRGSSWELTCPFSEPAGQGAQGTRPTRNK